MTLPPTAEKAVLFATSRDLLSACSNRKNLLFGLKLEWVARRQAKVVTVTIRTMWEAVLGLSQVLSIQKEVLMLS